MPKFLVPVHPGPVSPASWLSIISMGGFGSLPRNCMPLHWSACCPPESPPPDRMPHIHFRIPPMAPLSLLWGVGGRGSDPPRPSVTGHSGSWAACASQSSPPDSPPPCAPWPHSLSLWSWPSLTHRRHFPCQRRRSPAMSTPHPIPFQKNPSRCGCIYKI